MNTETEIHYMLVDPTAAADGTPTASAKQPWADPNRLHEEDETPVLRKFATLEQNAFALDGTFELFPDAPEQEDMGLWSLAQSGAGGAFAEPPALTVAFSQPHTALGVTLTFSALTQDWASSVHIKWYGANGETLADEDFSPGSASFFCDRLVQDFYKLVITFRRTNKPYRFLKLYRVRYGVVEDLKGDDITEASLVEECDWAGATVSVNTFRFGFYANRRFDLLDMSGVYSVFQQQQCVQVRQRVDGVLREMGRYYTDAPEVQDERVVSIDCIDLVGVLGQTEYMGGLWLSGIAAGELIKGIMQSAKLADEYELDPALAGVVIKGYLPICTHREALRQAAFAVCAAIRAARRDTLLICKPSGAAASTITPFDKEAGHRQKQREYVSGVEVYTHNYVLSSDTTQLFQAACQVGEQTVKFSSPATSLSCSGAAIKASGVNYAVLTVAAAGTVTLTGRAYEDQTSLGGSVYAARLPAGAHANVKTVEDCTLTADAQAVAQRLYDYYRKRIEDNGNLFVVDAVAGDTVAVEAAGSRTLAGVVESMEIDLAGGGIAKAVIVGG